MQRRQFMQTMAAMGALGAMPLWGRRVHAASAAPQSLPLFITMAASGGWDATLVCDPKGSPINPFSLSSGVVQVGAFTVPTASSWTLKFFQRYYQKMLVINGVNVPTNSHEIGTRYTSSGSQTAGFPCFEALAAAAHGPTLGLSFVSGFGGNATNGEVALTGMSDSTVAALSGSAATPYLSSSILAQISAARAARLQRIAAGATYPVGVQRLEQLADARGSTADFAKVQATVADLTANVPIAQGSDPDLSPSIGLYLQARLALAGYVHGLTISADLQGCQNTPVGSLDTHSNHDSATRPCSIASSRLSTTCCAARTISAFKTSCSSM